MSKLVDLTGQRFGRLVVLERAENIGRQTAWLCQCDCGNKKTAQGWNLKSGHIKSCGCLWRDVVPENNKEVNTRHGETGTKLHKTWVNMRYRCHNPKCKAYPNYGGRGISICEEWNSYEAFRDWSLENGFGAGKSIDRINVDGDYCPENCRWVYDKQQQNNKRNNNFLSFDGQTHTVQEWADMTGIKWSTIKERMKSGWPIERALTEKPNHKQKAD